MAISILDDHFMVCTDCLMIIANDDASGLDYSLDEAAAAEREKEIREAIADLEGHIAVGDSGNDEEFSVSPCECCGTREAGKRHHCLRTV